MSDYDPVTILLLARKQLEYFTHPDAQVQHIVKGLGDELYDTVKLIWTKEQVTEGAEEFYGYPSAPISHVVGEPEREALIDLLQSAHHAPMETHNRQSGECSECPWPLYALGPVEIADAILAAGYRREPLDSTTGENQ